MKIGVIWIKLVISEIQFAYWCIEKLNENAYSQSPYNKNMDKMKMKFNFVDHHEK